MDTVLFVLIGVLLILLIGFLIFSFIFYHKNIEKILKYRTWRKIYSLAKDRDYYLLNNVNIVDVNKSSFHIDHLLIGDRFVFCICARYFDGNLIFPEAYSPRLQLNDNKGNLIRLVDNPVYVNEVRMLKLANYLSCFNEKKNGIFVSIVATNNDLNFSITKGKFIDNSQFCHLKDLKKVIKTYEKNKEIPLLKTEDLQNLVDRLHNLSVKNNKIEEDNKQSLQKSHH